MLILCKCRANSPDYHTIVCITRQKNLAHTSVHSHCGFLRQMFWLTGLRLIMIRHSIGLFSNRKWGIPQRRLDDFCILQLDVNKKPYLFQERLHSGYFKIWTECPVQGRGAGQSNASRLCRAIGRETVLFGMDCQVAQRWNVYICMGVPNLILFRKWSWIYIYTTYIMMSTVWLTIFSHIQSYDMM